jgi:hypothetical protein
MMFYLTMCWHSWSSTWKDMKLNLSFVSHTDIYSSWNAGLNATKIKLMQENRVNYVYN